MISLDELEIYTGAEASKILKKDSSYIRQLYAKYPNRFPKGSIRKIGKEYIVTKRAIDTLMEQNENKQKRNLSAK